MSWCRWGSVCTNGPARPENIACVAAGCPGSDIYVYQSAGPTVCCLCSLNGDKDFETRTELEMQRHILEHEDAGHHVRRSMVADALKAIAEAEKPRPQHRRANGGRRGGQR